MTYLEAAELDGPIFLIGCDPGPVCSAICLVSVVRGRALLLMAEYTCNKDLGNCVQPPAKRDDPVFLCYEACGAQGAFVGESTFETAAMGGEIRRMFRPFVDGTYAFSPADWRYLLCGQGNARTPLIYAECCKALGPGTGGGADPYRGTKSKPGQLAGLYAAGKGGNVEHLKDALGTALALTRCAFRTGESPEKFRRPW